MGSARLFLTYPMGLLLPILAMSSPGAGIPPVSPSRLPDRLIDSHGRTIRDLRLSITDRCNFRCVYCMEPDVRFTPYDQLLSVEDLVRLARGGGSLGIEKKGI